MEHSEQYPESYPRHHMTHIKKMLNDLAPHLRSAAKKLDNPPAQALCETTADVLQRLFNAYDHFEQKSEEAWK